MLRLYNTNRRTGPVRGAPALARGTLRQFYSTNWEGDVSSFQADFCFKFTSSLKESLRIECAMSLAKNGPTVDRSWVWIPISPPREPRLPVGRESPAAGQEPQGPGYEGTVAESCVPVTWVSTTPHFHQVSISSRTSQEPPLTP